MSDRYCAACGSDIVTSENIRMDTGVGLIASERERQREIEGYTDEHDDAHTAGLVAIRIKPSKIRPVRLLFPCIDPYRDYDKILVQAGALIAAELDRRQRAKAKVPA